MNFSHKTSSHQEKDIGTDHGTSADPMSHRIIEKRRRDRMNNCLADLSRLIPADYLKKGRGRVEKTEIIEMAIKHMKHLQALACRQIDQCELNQQRSPEEQTTQHSSPGGGGGPIVVEHYRLGYQECLSETMHFMVEVEGFFAGDPLCIELMNHLQKHCDKILKGNHINYPRSHLVETTSTSSGSTGSGSYHHTNSIALGSSAPGSSSSPGSGSCSDSGRNDIKDPLINGHQSTVHCLSKVIPPQTLTNENSCNEENHSNHSGPSQLREMLTGSRSSSSLQIVNNKQNTLTPLPQTFQSPSPGISNVLGNSSSVEHNGINGSSSAASLYKFKNNIKQRFSAEHHVNERHHDSSASNVIDPPCHYGGMKRRRYISDINDETPQDSNTNNLLTFPMVQPTSRRRDSETCSVPSSPPSPEPKYIPPRSPSPEITRTRGSPHRPIPSYGIPIFALHPKGTFYIPLTIDSEVLAPHFSDLGYVPELIHEVLHPVILHPVTISVNFQRVGQYPRTQRMMQPQLNHCSSASWNNEQNGFVP